MLPKEGKLFPGPPPTGAGIRHRSSYENAELKPIGAVGGGGAAAVEFLPEGAGRESKVPLTATFTPPQRLELEAPK